MKKARAYEALVEQALDLVAAIDAVKVDASDVTIQDVEVFMSLVDLRVAVYRFAESARSVRGTA